MNSYFFYYFEKADSSVPFFEVVNCDNDDHAIQRCGRLLALRGCARAEVWLEDKFICRLDGPRHMEAVRVRAA